MNKTRKFERFNTNFHKKSRPLEAALTFYKKKITFFR
jgi:hypothetical protein